MLLQRTHTGNGYGFGVSGQEGNVSEDDVDRSELEAEARVLPERELLSLISDDSSPESPAESSPPGGDGEEVPQSDSESTTS
jgi:hypothetical protein